MKYRPEFPDRFGCIQDSRAFGHSSFTWYNSEHRHSSLALLTPEMVHFGLATDLVAQRQVVLDAAFLAHPERFVHKPPVQAQPPVAVWINKPPVSENDTH
jgi:putative transposase